MGLLDDAIREHLELKRRHGADPTEVARQEHEALGPARREPQPEPEAHEPEPEAPAPEAEPEAVADDPQLEPQTYEPQPEAEPFAPEPEPEPPAEARRIEPDLVDQPTVEHPAAKPEPLIEDEIFDLEEEEEPQPRKADGEGDVLEATPEFLEETPEHDRLWFEQRPPRDFDFDD
jgi:hypothetical protein